MKANCTFSLEELPCLADHQLDGTPFVPMRTYFEGKPGVVPQSEPFLAADVRIMEGGGNRTVFIVPSKQLVIFRHGQQVSDWDNARLVNMVLRPAGAR